MCLLLYFILTERKPLNGTVSEDFKRLANASHANVLYIDTYLTVAIYYGAYDL